MAALRRFTCYDCGKSFEVPYGTGVPGRRMNCPECGGSNVHRATGYQNLDQPSHYWARAGSFRPGIRNLGGGPAGWIGRGRRWS